MARTTFIRALMALLAVTGVTLASAPASADSDNGYALDDVLEGGDESSIERALSLANALRGAAAGAGDRIIWEFAPESLYPRSSSTAEEEATALTKYYNSHNDTLETYANARGNITENKTVKIELHIEDSTSTRFVVATAEGGSLTNSTMVETTNATVDETVSLCGYAADQALEELTHFTEEYAEEDEDIDSAYLGRLRGRYGDDVETSLVKSSGECGS